MLHSRSSALPIIASLALLVLAALMCVYASLGHSEIVGATERDNQAFTGRIAAELVTDIDSFVQAFGNSSPESVRRAPETAALRARLLNFIQSKRVVKVKIYSLDGRALFSSDLAQIGSGVSTGVDLKAIARLENQFSKLEFRSKFVGFDRVPRDLYVVSSYVPVFGAGGRTSAVLEIYTDVTEQAQNAVWTKWAANLSMAIAIAIFGFVMFRVMRQRGRQVASTPAALKAVNAEGANC